MNKHIVWMLLMTGAWLVSPPAGAKQVCGHWDVADGGPRYRCWDDGTSASSSSNANRQGSSASSMQGVSDALNNYSRNLQERERQRGEQEQREQQAAHEQKMLQERQQLLDENRRLQEQTRAWQEKQGQKGGSDSDGDKKSKDKMPKVADNTRGCPFLMYPDSGNTHAPGSTFCHQGKTLRCDMNGKVSDGIFTYAWRAISTNSCIAGFTTPSAKESNLVNLQKINDNFFEEF